MTSRKRHASLADTGETGLMQGRLKVTILKK